LNSPFRLISTLAAIIAAACAFAISIFSYLAAASVHTVGCAGPDVSQGYLSGVSDFVAWPLLSFFIVAVLVMVRRNQKMIDLVETNDVTVLEFSSFRITFGMLIACTTILIFVAGSGLLTVHSITRDWQISKYCQSITVPS
jgi:hypothetical protein